jgi:hypothetical protein
MVMVGVVCRETGTPISTRRVVLRKAVAVQQGTVREKNVVLLRCRDGAGAVSGRFPEGGMPTGSSGLLARRGFQTMISPKPISDRHARRQQSSGWIYGL